MRFNFKNRQAKLVNHEGAQAWKMSTEAQLYAAVVTTALHDAFYEKADKRLERIRELISASEPEFVAKLAVYAREKMYLRTIPLVLAVELARIHKGDDLVARMVNRIVQRADEITELLACYQNANERTGTKKLNKLSKQLQKGLAAAFNRFDEYQFAKYNREAAVKLRDALFLVHPKPANEGQQSIFDKIARDTLTVPYTWEVELSRLGQQGYAHAQERKAAFRNKWAELIESGALGYMALLRNLRNILEADVPAEAIQKVANRLGDAKEVARSKQLPFRFLSAYRELKEIQSTHTSRILDALELAMEASAANLKGFGQDTRVLIAADTSGSMQSPISKGKVMYYDIGLVLGMMLQSRCQQVITGMFGDTWKIITLPGKGILRNADALRSRMGEVGYSTNGYLVIRDLIHRKVKMDKVMIFTDCQLYNSSGGSDSLQGLWAKYKGMYPDAKLYVFDLAGYGQSPVRQEQQDVSLIAGWSDKIFDVLEAIENGGNALGEIRKINL